MKVAIVQEQVDVRRGGAETSTLEMARQLASLGVDVTVVTGDWGLGIGDWGLEIVECEVGNGSRVGRAVRFVAEADRYCREAGFDVVHAVTPCFSCDVYQPRGGTYVEAVERSVARAGGPMRRLIKRVGRRFNRRQRFLLLVERGILTGREPPFVAAVSEYVGRQVRSAFPDFPGERLHVVFNGVDVEAPAEDEEQTRRSAVRRELGVDESEPLVLFAAHNFKLKGLAELVRAVAVIPDLNQSPALGRVGQPHLVVVGRDDAGRYARLARRLGVSDRVRFVGAVDDMRGFYAAADALAHPTWYDPCSRVVLEALGCGLPVVTTRFNGAAEVIEAGRHGVVIDSPRDVKALAGGIVACLEPELRAGCRAGAAEMRERLSMARHARELTALYEEVVAAKALRRV